MTSGVMSGQSFRERLREISMFFNKDDRIHQTMRRVSDKLEQAQIPYAVVGGMAVNAHRYVRTTADVDFLLTAAGMAAFLQSRAPGEFPNSSGHPRRFVDGATGVTFEILLTGLFPGSGRPGPISYPDPDLVSEVIDDTRVLNLPSLTELKLAARRYKDFGDVVELIRVHNLDESFSAKLHPSIRSDFIECLEKKRREDEYEARQDQAFERERGSDSAPRA